MKDCPTRLRHPPHFQNRKWRGNQAPSPKSSFLDLGEGWEGGREFGYFHKNDNGDGFLFVCFVIFVVSHLSFIGFSEGDGHPEQTIQ